MVGISIHEFTAKHTVINFTRTDYLEILLGCTTVENDVSVKGVNCDERFSGDTICRTIDKGDSIFG